MWWPFKKKKENKEQTGKQNEQMFSTYPGFPHHSGELNAFLPSIEIFTISLKDGRIIHHQPENYQTFFDWLLANNIQNIKKPLDPVA